MSDQITIRPAEGVWVVRAGGAVIGESKSALELQERGHAPVIYFPRANIAMALLEQSQTASVCQFKGAATYYSIMAKSGPIVDAAWSYENPAAGMEAIAGHLAFYPDKVAVEEV